MVFLTGCSSSATSTDATRAPSDSAGSAASQDPASWCADYFARTSVLTGSLASADTARAALDEMGPIGQLWADAAERGYVTSEELAATQPVLDATTAVLALYAGGSTEDSEEVAAAQEELSSASAKGSALVASANGKLRTLCAASTVSPSPTSS